MKHVRKSVFALFLVFALLLSMLPGFKAQAAVIGTIRITMTAPEVGKALPTDAHVTNNANMEVTDVEWSGKTKDGKVTSGTKYTAVITLEVKPDKDDKFTTGKISTMVNGKASNIKVNRESTTVVKVTYTFSLNSKAVDKNGKPVKVTLEGTKGKNASEVKALKKIIEKQMANGAALPMELYSHAYYEFNKEGRLVKLHWVNDGLKGSLSLEAFPALEDVWLSENQLTKLDVSKNPNLWLLWCGGNQLTVLDISKNPNLLELWFSYDEKSVMLIK